MSVVLTNTYYDRIAEIFNLPKERVASMRLIMEPCEVVRIEVGLAPTKEQVDEFMDVELKNYCMMELMK